MTAMYPRRRLFSLPLPTGELRLGERPLVMGILNVTPDSFAETESRIDSARSVELALQMEAQGADLIDIGGESTRPGSDPLSLEEELARVVPVVRDLGKRLRVPISIDTYKAGVASAALDLGASLVNDVSGLRFDPALAKVVAEHGAGLIVMHTRGRPRTMYSEATYENVVAEVASELKVSLDVAQSAGVLFERIVVDPGIGFAKRPEHSYGVLARLDRIAEAVERPVLVGPSRKSFLRSALNDRPAAERDWGTSAAVTSAVLAGAHMVRVHAVAEMVQVVKVAEEIRRHGSVIT
jgi:dihydropteroate synthase